MASPAQAIATASYCWLLPQYRFLASAVGNLSFALAPLLGQLASFYHKQGSLCGGTFFAIAAASSLLSLGAYGFLVPSRDDFRALQAEAMAGKRAGDGSEASGSSAGAARSTTELPAVRKEGAVGSEAPGLWRNLRDVCALVTRSPTFGLGGALFVTHIFALYMQQVVVLLEQYHYYTALFGWGAEGLLETYGTLFAVVGFPMTVVFSLLADSMPTWLSLLVWDVAALAFFGATVVPQLAAQYASLIALAFIVSLYYLVGPPFTMLYAPPELFGTFMGLTQAIYGVAQIAIVAAEDAVAEAIAPEEAFEDERLVAKLTTWTVISAVFAAANYAAWARRPPSARTSCSPRRSRPRCRPRPCAPPSS